MAETNTMNNLNGLFKTVYGKLETLYPDNVIIIKDVKLDRARRTGKDFKFPVVLGKEQGFTGALSGSGAFTYNDAIAGKVDEVVVKGHQIVLRTLVDGETLASSSSNKNSFQRATKHIVENMYESMSERVEAITLYGQEGFGQVTVSNGSGTTATITWSDATFSPGLAGALSGGAIDLYDTTTLQNTNAALIVSNVSIKDKTATVTGNASDITTLGTQSGLDVYGYKFYGNEAAGLVHIVKNTGTLFGIDASVYDMWRGNVEDAGGALSDTVLGNAIAVARGRGLNTGVTVYVAPRRWAQLATIYADKQRFDQSASVKSGKLGTERLEVYSQTGALEIVSHPIMKESEALVLPLKRVQRIGASDITFDPSGKNSNYFNKVTGTSGYELVLYSHQAPVITRPSECILITGITD